MNSPVLFRLPPVLKPGEPGNRENGLTMRVCGLFCVSGKAFQKPGNRENRTALDFSGILARQCARRMGWGFCAEGFPLPAPRTGGLFGGGAG